MEIIEAVPILEEYITNTNVPINDYIEWQVGNTYNEDQRVVYGTSVYQSLIASNLGNQPDTSPTSWVRVSAVNRFKAFDNLISSGTENNNLISYNIELPITVNSIAMFGLSAEEVQIFIIDTVTGQHLMNQRYQLISEADVYDGWSYFFSPIEYETQLVLTDLPAWAGESIQIRIRAPNGVAEVSEILIGTNHEIGETLVDTEMGLIDYSFRQRNEFGDIQITERGYTNKVTYKFAFETEDARRIRNLMARIRNKVSVFHAGRDNDQFGLTVPGFYKDFNVPLTSVLSYGSLEVESLI